MTIDDDLAMLTRNFLTVKDREAESLAALAQLADEAAGGRDAISNQARTGLHNQLQAVSQVAYESCAPSVQIQLVSLSVEAVWKMEMNQTHGNVFAHAEFAKALLSEWHALIEAGVCILPDSYNDLCSAVLSISCTEQNIICNLARLAGEPVGLINEQDSTVKMSSESVVLSANASLAGRVFGHRYGTTMGRWLAGTVLTGHVQPERLLGLECLQEMMDRLVPAAENWQDARKRTVACPPPDYPPEFFHAAVDYLRDVVGVRAFALGAKTGTDAYLAHGVQFTRFIATLVLHTVTWLAGAWMGRRDIHDHERPLPWTSVPDMPLVPFVQRTLVRLLAGCDMIRAHYLAVLTRATQHGYVGMPEELARAVVGSRQHVLQSLLQAGARLSVQNVTGMYSSQPVLVCTPEQHALVVQLDDAMKSIAELLVTCHYSASNKLWLAERSCARRALTRITASVGRADLMLGSKPVHVGLDEFATQSVERRRQHDKLAREQWSSDDDIVLVAESAAVAAARASTAAASACGQDVAQTHMDADWPASVDGRLQSDDFSSPMDMQ